MTRDKKTSAVDQYTVTKTIHNDLSNSIMISAPVNIIASIVSEWLDLKDLGKLDTSIVNYIFRERFLFHLHAYPSVKYSAFTHHNLNSNMILQWASIRKIRWLKLKLTKCDEFPKELFVSCQQMTTLHLEHCHSLTDDMLTSLMRCAPLVDFKLWNCGLISDESLVALASDDDCAPLQLQSLSIGHCSALSDVGLSAFADKQCRVLESFTVIHCNVSAAGVGRVLVSASSTLHKVNCDHCLELSEVETLLQYFVQLTSTSHVLLEEFTIAHRDLMSMSQAVSCVGAWMPHVSALEGNLRTPLALSVVEELGKSQGSEDFQMVIKYIKGGVYPKPPKYTQPTAAADVVECADYVLSGESDVKISGERYQ
jgi:hypothetical protein